MSDGDRRVGSLIRRVRKQNGMTLADLSAAIDHAIGVATLSKIERGECRIRVSQIDILAPALGASLSELVFGASRLLPHGGNRLLVEVGREVVSILDQDEVAS